MEIELDRLLKVLLKRSWIIILLTLVTGMTMFYYSKEFKTPIYTASTSFYVQNTTNYQGNINANDLLSSQALADTITVLLKSDTIMGKVVEELGVNIQPQQLASMVSTSTVESTGVMLIMVSDSNPQFAQQVANAIGTVAPKEIINFIEAGNVELLDKAALPYFPSYPTPTKDALLAAAVIFVIACAVVIFMELLDTRIKTEDDITRITNLSILGTIPNITKIATEVSAGGKKKDR
jgi:capsular polysaccharide biosynthesis protein